MNKALLPALLVLTVAVAGWMHYSMRTSDDVARASATGGHPSAPPPVTDAAAAAIAKARDVIIEQKTAALVGTRRTVELTSEKAQTVHQSIEAGDFATARRIVDEVYASSSVQGWSFYPFSVFMGNVVVPATAEFGERLDEWIATDAGYALARVIRGYYFDQIGWQVRGAHFAADTQDAHMRAFRELITKATADADAAIALDASNPWAYFLRLNTLSGRGNSDEMAQAFQQASARYPNYYPLYTMRMRTLAPKWGGSVNALIDFVERHAGGADATSPLKLLYLELYRQLLDVATTACSSAEDHAREACVNGALVKLMPENLFAHVAEAISLRRHADPFQFANALSYVLAGMLEYKAARKFTDPVVQMAADALGTENQLMEEHPGHNDFRLDVITADIWMRENHKNNAETKYQEAIRDMKNASFPGEEEHAVALAGIYAKLAEVYRDNAQFEDAIAYSRAAGAVGGPPFQRSTIVCYSYYRLKDFESALADCDAVYQRSADFDALYWRARMELKLKQTDAAIADFTAIADSEHGWRTSAVIYLSVLYGELKDPQSALTVFGKYDYVFDEDQRSNSDLAVVYNNRCYAYKELGQLDKALADCNASLRFGNIPDALQKKHDIEKRIKAGEKGV